MIVLPLIWGYTWSTVNAVRRGLSDKRVIKDQETIARIGRLPRDLDLKQQLIQDTALPQMSHDGPFAFPSIKLLDSCRSDVVKTVFSSMRRQASPVLVTLFLSKWPWTL